MDSNQIAAAADVTPAYARMIIAGTRTPSLKRALRIYDALGLQFGPLAALSKRQIDIARKMAPDAEQSA